MDNFKQRVLGKYEGLPGMVLTFLLIGAALVILSIALFSRSNLFKAAALAYVTLP